MNAIKKHMSENHLEVLMAECEERNMTLDDYLVVYLLSKHGHEFWDHVDNLLLKHWFGDCDETMELDPSLRDYN